MPYSPIDNRDTSLLNLISASIFMAIAALLLSSCATSGPLEFIETSESYEQSLVPYDGLDYEIYNTVIRTLYLHSRIQRIVITRETETLTPVTESAYEDVEISIPGLDRELFDSLYWMMQTPWKLSESYFKGLPVYHDMVSKSSVSGLFAAGSWDLFYNEFPRSQGLMSFSRVAYSHDLRKALVYVGNQKSGRDGKGYIVYLVRHGDYWHIAGRYTLWVS